MATGIHFSRAREITKIKCENCGREFYSPLWYMRGKKVVYIDCPKCRDSKLHLEKSIELYKKIYGGE